MSRPLTLTFDFVPDTAVSSFHIGSVGEIKLTRSFIAWLDMLLRLKTCSRSVSRESADVV